jgi:YHS domain-containing protein
MNQRGKHLVILIFVLAIALFGLIAYAQDHNHHQGGGRMRGQGQGRMGRGGEGRMEDMKTIHALFDEHQKITRTVKKTENGVETLTESDDPKVQALIVEHVWAMKKRLENKQPIRMWDPLFAELFKNADKIKMEIVKTPKGAKVIETSGDPWVVKLIQSHAEGVSEFVKEGMSSMHKSHELPGEKPVELKFLGKGDGVTTCPVTGEPVNKGVKFGFYGRTVYFCCESCRDAVKKNPELYLKP